jgi:hypothetical protein
LSVLRALGRDYFRQLLHFLQRQRECFEGLPRLRTLCGRGRLQVLLQRGEALTQGRYLLVKEVSIH